jgi:hypothetical protein
MLVSNLREGNNVSLSHLLSSNHSIEDAHHQHLAFAITRVL